jgi:SNF2 family DNA or RNA helicase|tara:strand:+ start:367 stop:1737 length:1371 start_codon:yes stop_codon:yes gene_type:complete
MNTQIPEAYSHQTDTTKFVIKNPRCLITSDPGTGKTRAVLDAHVTLGGKTLVLAPLSILEAAWVEDIVKFQPTIKYGVAYAKNRAKIFNDSSYQMVITNFEAVNFLRKNLHLLNTFNTIVIDEFTAFKNRQAKRSKNLKTIISHFNNRIAMSGTPNTNSILDIWHPTLLVDDGKRLGDRFYSFRNQVCTPQFNGFANEWKDKPGIEEVVADKLKDITIRHALEDCIDLPDKIVRNVYTTLSPTVARMYKTLADESVLYTQQGTINAVNAGARVKKLLQLVSGGVYDQDGVAQYFHQERYNLVMDLVEERKHSLVAFNWKHERDALITIAKKKKISYELIDGSVPAQKRKDIVARFQAGQLKVLFAHPQSAGHGLTLTRATTCIWCSPTYNAEHFQQFNRRIYRAGQTSKTETILISAKNTWEEEVYVKLNTKLGRMENLLHILSELNNGQQQNDLS